MYKSCVTVINPSGLHARPASEFVRLATTFSSKISIKNVGTDSEANAKSIVMLLSLGLNMGTEVEISAAGPDEQQAVDALVALVASGFGE